MPVEGGPPGPPGRGPIPRPGRPRVHRRRSPTTAPRERRPPPPGRGPSIARDRPRRPVEGGPPGPPGRGPSTARDAPRQRPGPVRIPRPQSSTTPSDRGRGDRLTRPPSLRTVQAIFSHTALRSVVCLTQDWRDQHMGHSQVEHPCAAGGRRAHARVVSDSPGCPGPSASASSRPTVRRRLGAWPLPLA